MHSPAPKYCHLTGLETTPTQSNSDIAEYTIEVNGKTIKFGFLWDHNNSKFVNDHQHIFKGLILNGHFPEYYEDPNKPYFENEQLEKIIRNSSFPKTPEDKLNYLLNHLHSLQEFQGSPINPVDHKLLTEELAHKLFFKNFKEMHFYLATLQNMGFVSYGSRSTMDGPSITDIKFTYKGLSKVIELNESGNLSDRCFIAMSFSKEQLKTRECLKETITECGYHPILIDEQHFDADITINDAIIAEIKKSRFVVADFTEQKCGVYFEAGFAVGLKRPVIYSCSQEDFKNTHFDTNHYPHVIYESLEQLRSKLKAKIEAWIN
ncbi:nucleoside 2-deoxyribosyltransferase [Muricauda sp. 2012CJ35-5]|uniref:Nucleoside 2-deoxyribosyltransferase n=1 Tax=Flagellimonas spongiicola TaxID=2942208 RepID=A0ABT0PMG7_9FLAO|nr:nucleoside 2-deoxyribosyltransferase [Allomuricauda spongiicola]MCL6272544.1 nucleoside 2-deoxyribosyltransferase [Allomuricauda spongiicola]